MEGGKEGGKEQGGDSQKGDRDKVITFPDLMCWMWTVLCTNERFSTDASTPVRLSSFNTTYTYRVKWMKEQDKWRDQHGKPVTDITPEESIDHLHENLLPTFHFLLHLLYFSPLVVLVIPLPTQLATTVFLVETHRETTNSHKHSSL